ncbi:hypothetical protein IQ03_03909 [Gemmobacter caeni]|jgi:hypothetical protein|uniref:Uncharacterized protein n=1 Tax=Gemmobacter caeni TaxID=589035 RepID=A0A2T6B988_9RHOB|nr:hypothetical protein [Gemmobacter caeni]PTX52635.1 hypothetical protein C8N34_102453 [Gemmobacter caeni]TWI94910.1 hypothetical protein IQ03_03909 [Gemmobacter caeni]
MNDDKRMEGDMSDATNRVGSKVHYTAEEAELLLRNVKGYGKRPSLFYRLGVKAERVAQNNRAVGWTLGAILGLIRFTIWNSRAGLFFGTLGYWTFGLLTAAWFGNYGGSYMSATGIRPVDMFLLNPLVMFALSVMLLVIGMNNLDDRPWVLMGLDKLVFMLSFIVAYLGAIIMGILFAISLLFGADKMGSSGTIMMMLFLFLIPAGFLAIVKLKDEM